MSNVSAITIPNIGMYEIKDGIARKNIDDISSLFQNIYMKSDTSSSTELDQKFLTCCDREQVSSIVAMMVDDVLQQQYGYDIGETT